MAATIRTTIDAGGRVVIPKPIRDHLGLSPGERVDLVIDGWAIRLTPVQPEIELVRKGRVLVARRPGGSKEPVTQEQVRDAIEAIRDERDRRFW